MFGSFKLNFMLFWATHFSLQKYESINLKMLYNKKNVLRTSQISLIDLLHRTPSHHQVHLIFSSKRERGICKIMKHLSKIV